MTGEEAHERSTMARVRSCVRSPRRGRGQAAELPTQNKKPNKAEPAQKCDIAGAPGVVAANGVCVRLSGYVSSQFSAGQLSRQYK